MTPRLFRMKPGKEGYTVVRLGPGGAARAMGGDVCLLVAEGTHENRYDWLQLLHPRLGLVNMPIQYMDEIK